MPAFDVTTNPTTLQPLKPGDTATIVVTATSRLTRPVTARANKVVDPKMFDPFVKPPANVQRTFNQAGATQDFQFTVQIAADAPPGKGTVRFDIVDTDQPDDNFGQSSALNLVVEAPPPAPPPPKPKVPWWVWLIAGVVLIGIGIVIWRVMAGGKDKMPNVVGMTFADAKAKIGIDSTRITRFDTLDLDTAAWKGNVVIRQYPPEGTSLKPDSTTVRLAVQKPFTVVPNIAGLPGIEAGRRLGDAGLGISLGYKCQTTPSSNEGHVVAFNPAATTLVPRNSTVAVTLLTVQTTCLTIIIPPIQERILQEAEQGRRVRVAPDS
ncbi:MAG TPA: PASTA domain-containing protein [Gemmatimonadales bacterium]|nr:PASTA domain-containing protein [Gemmatimonadales bacterium]